MKKQLLIIVLLLATNASLQAYVSETPEQKITYPTWVNKWPQPKKPYLDQYTKALHSWKKTVQTES